MKDIKIIKRELRRVSAALKTPLSPQLFIALMAIRGALEFALDRSDIDLVEHYMALSKFSIHK